MLHKLNQDTMHDQYGYRYMLGGLEQFLKAWGQRHDRTSVIIDVWPGGKDPGGVWADGRVFDHPFEFRCKLPNRVRYKLIHAALALASKQRTSVWGERSDGSKFRSGARVTGVGALTADRSRSDDITTYRGDTRDALEILLRTFQMPDHQALLKAPASQRRY